MASDPLEGWYQEIIVTSWDELQTTVPARLKTALGRLPGAEGQWIFRGQPSAKYSLETTLDRFFRRTYGPDEPVCPEYGTPEQWAAYRTTVELPSNPHFRKEVEMTTSFQRRFSSLVPNGPIPDEKASFEWLSLIRHYGGPCRLLDFTYSYYVALFFALEDADEDAAVWALKPAWLDLVMCCNMLDVFKQIRSAGVSMRPETYWTVFGEGNKFVRMVEPWYHNDRLTTQQGVFLCPGDVSAPFYQNLLSLLLGGPKEPDIATRQRLAQVSFAKVVIKFDKLSRRRILSHLCDMNITRATLFPGVAGLAGSLTQSGSVRSFGETCTYLVS